MNEKNNVIQYDASIIKRALQAQDNPWRETDEYSIGPDGIFIRTIKVYKNGVEDARWNLIHPFPLMPIEFIDAATDDAVSTPFDTENQVSVNESKAFIKVKFLDLIGNEVIVKLPQAELTQLTKNSELTKRWQPPSSSKASKVVEIMQKVLKDGQSSVLSPAGIKYDPCIKYTRGIDKCGWDKTFTKHIRPGHQDYVGEHECLTLKAGSAELHIGTMANWIESDLQLALSETHKLSGYAKKIIYKDNVNHILILVGPPGMGKSARLGAMATAEGCMIQELNRTLINSNFSWAGIERHIKLINHGYLCIDELDKIASINKNTAAEIILGLANQTTRRIAQNNSSSKARPTDTFSLNIIAAANTSILERLKGHPDYAAISSRIFEIDIRDPEITGYQGDLTVINVWKRLLEENYGHVYERVIKHITENRIALINDFTRLQNELLTKEEYTHFQHYQRDAEFVAYLQIGADLVSKIYGEKAGVAAHKAVEIFRRRYTLEIGQVYDKSAGAKAIMNRFKEWIADNIGSMRVNGFAYTMAIGRSQEEAQLEYAERLTNNATTSRGGAIAGLEQSRPMAHPTDFEGRIFIKAEAERFLEKAGLNISEIMVAAEELDLLPKSKKGSLEKRLKLSDQKTSWLAGVSKEELADIRKNKQMDKYNINTYAKCIILEPEVESEVNMDFEDEDFQYSNIDSNDLDEIVENNLAHVMYDVPKI